MAEELKGLIEKIHQEGIQAAQDKAKAIEDEAKQKAQVIIEKAKKEASRITQEAQDKNAKSEATTEELLKQAGRDLLLSLRAEINAMLDKLITTSVQEALNIDGLAKIITALIKDYCGKDKAEVVVGLSKEDTQKLEKGFLSSLTEETKKGITLRSSQDIHGGFVISFDGGKSHYDFTDKALAEYIATSLKPRLAEILTCTTPT